MSEAGIGLSAADPVSLEAKTPSDAPGRPSRTLRFVGNVITAPFSKVVSAVADACDLTCHHSDFGQVMQVLSAPAGEDYLAIHLDHRWFFDAAVDERAVARAEDLASRVLAWLEISRGTIILNTISAPVDSPVDADLHTQVGRLAEINGILCSLAAQSGRVRILDVAGIVLRLGADATWRERNRYIMQHPYSPEAAARVVAGYARIIRTDLRARRKVIVLDADNTLWGGVLGEDGPDGVVVDQEYPGVAYHVFQRQLARLRTLGYLLAVVTKNNESDFLEVFERRSMPLKLSDFVAYRSNWKEKSDNIADLALELNLGVESFVFIDDNPFEIDEVRGRLPGVECWLFPKDRPEAVIRLLSDIDSLRTAATTAEDLVKTEQYRTETERKALKASAESLEDYLSSLDIAVEVGLNQAGHAARVAQLTNKTNQFNLTTRRYTESDILQFMTVGAVYDFRVSDKFGDLGIVGVVIVVDGQIDTFLMSCRALGRKIEAAMLRFVTAREAKPLKAFYRRTAKNDMVSTFFDDNGFALVSSSEGEKHYLMSRGPENVGHVRFVEP